MILIFKSDPLRWAPIWYTEEFVAVRGNVMYPREREYMKDSGKSSFSKSQPVPWVAIW